MLSRAIVLAGLVASASAHADSKAAKPAPVPEDFIADAKELLVVGACAEGTSAHVKPDVIAAHCKTVKPAQAEYKKEWLVPATEFFKQIIPPGLPKTIVYPFAGGDLSTALTLFPDADEITTLSLEPAGDPRALGKLSEAQVGKSLAVISREITELYRASFSKTMNMIESMRGGELPTQLVFSLSALYLHGYEPVALRYFQLDSGGNIVYLTAADVARLDRIKDVGAHNRGFGNVELVFKKPGSKHEQIYRHIQANLDNEHLGKWRAPLRHLEKKGKVTGMTKAASYLLSYGDFAQIRNYLMGHVDWMVSDTTGVPPSYGAPTFEYEVWGDWKSANMNAGNGAVRATWKQLFAEKPHRDMKFRFGYPNGAGDGHLVVMKRAAKAK